MSTVARIWNMNLLQRMKNVLWVDPILGAKHFCSVSTEAKWKIYILKVLRVISENNDGKLRAAQSGFVIGITSN